MKTPLHSTQNHLERERLRAIMASLILGMVPLVIVGSLISGANYWVVGPLAGLVGVLAMRVLAHYFPYVRGPVRRRKSRHRRGRGEES